MAAKILIVDDNATARVTLRSLLDWHGFQVWGEAEDGKESIQKVIELKPDIVLMDINMPGMNGIAAASEIRRIAPQTKIIFLTIHDGPGFRAGTRPWAHGFVPKSAAGTELIPTLNRITGISADEMIIECPHCRVRQKIHVARAKASKIERQFLSCPNCGNEFDVKVPAKILGGPFIGT